ncbi:MAG: PAS domain S-box protein [Caldimonas sp.]
MTLQGQTATPAGPSAFDETTVFRKLFTAYADALVVADASGTIVLANPSAATLLGYRSEELIGLNVDVLVPDVIRPRHASYRDAYGRSPRARPMGTQMELVAKRRDGSEVMVEIALSPLQAGGQALVVAAIRDIGAYPRIRRALQRARYSEHLAQLGRLAVNARDAHGLMQQVPSIAAQALEVEVAIVYLLEPDRLSFRVSAGVGMVGGESIGALIPSHADTPAGYMLGQGSPLIVDDFRSEHRFTTPAAYLEAGLRSGLSVPLTDRGRTIGVLAVCTHEIRHFDDDATRFLESLSNLLATSLQRAESEEALNHAQRLESVGQLTGGIAHDFNNLLTVIQGNLQVLEELPGLVGDAYAQQLVAAAVRASRRGAELTSKLLAFSRRQVLQPRSVDLRTLLGSLADMLRRTLDQRVGIEVVVPDACPPVLADPVQLESALLNIAINARDAMPDGGHLRFQAEACASLPLGVRNEFDDPSAAEEQFVSISIADSGGGMSEEVKERAFEPFFTTKEAGRGTGLGLSTVYGFVKQSKGAVSIESKLGSGTTVTLFIPRPWHEEEPVVEAAGATVPSGLQVLLVEDDTEVRSVVRSFLDLLECRVTMAATGEQALLALGPNAPFDLLLTDIALGPGMRGTQLATEVQQRFPRVAVLLMSGYSAELIEADQASPPSWELLRKPYSRQELARSIAKVMATRAAG